MRQELTRALPFHAACRGALPRLPEMPHRTGPKTSQEEKSGRLAPVADARCIRRTQRIPRCQVRDHAGANIADRRVTQGRHSRSSLGERCCPEVEFGPLNPQDCDIAAGAARQCSLGPPRRPSGGQVFFAAMSLNSTPPFALSSLADSTMVTVTEPASTL